MPGGNACQGDVVCPVVRDGTGWRARPVQRPDRDCVLPGRGDSYDRAIADFSVTHADRNEQDCAALVKAVESGRSLRRPVGSVHRSEPPGYACGTLGWADAPCVIVLPALFPPEGRGRLCAVRKPAPSREIS